MRLIADIQDACQALPQLDSKSRCLLIDRVIRQLEIYLHYARQNLPANKWSRLETLVLTARPLIEEIAFLETEELSKVLLEFETLILVLDEIMARSNGSPTRH